MIALQDCVNQGEYATAGSFLVILQTMDSIGVCRQRATLLLELAVLHDEWDLVRDLIRFIKVLSMIHRNARAFLRN
jgi:hypothetical protein